MPYEKSCSTKEAAQVFLKISQNPQENTFARVSFLTKLQEVCNFIKKETLAQVFFSEFCEIFKNNFFTEQFWATASAIILNGRTLLYGKPCFIAKGTSLFL